jgi:hypothetical protein
MKHFPLSCPSCLHQLEVRRLACPHCDTQVEGSFPLPELASLPAEDQTFIVEFVKSSGSLKEMAGHLKVSYPTVRNRLDDIIAKLHPPTS